MVFQGVDAYVTPSWYASKREHGKVVPTWNYAIVQAGGRPRVVEDPVWLGAQIRALTAQEERTRAEPWAVDDAPVTFVAAQIKGIVGIEIPIARIEGKWKASQNRPPTGRAWLRGWKRRAARQHWRWRSWCASGLSRRSAAASPAPRGSSDRPAARRARP